MMRLCILVSAVVLLISLISGTLAVTYSEHLSLSITSRKFNSPTAYFDHYLDIISPAFSTFPMFVDNPVWINTSSIQQIQEWQTSSCQDPYRGASLSLTQVAWDQA